MMRRVGGVLSLLSFLLVLLFPSRPRAQFTESLLPSQPWYQNQTTIEQQRSPYNNKYRHQTCSFNTSGWSEWIPSNCNKCGQSRYRYCLGAYNGCGEWYCLGNRMDYCQSPCPRVRVTDPRVRVDRSTERAACGARVSFSCPDCYRAEGQQWAECLANGTWSHPVPKCSPVTCREPIPITNGYVKWGSNCGSSAVYKCYYGYELRGSDELQCSSRGYWDPPDPPICLPVKCPHLTRPENGVLIMLSRSFRSRAYFRCRLGYKLHGPRSIRCSASGSWSLSPPACVRSTSFWD